MECKSEFGKHNIWKRHHGKIMCYCSELVQSASCLIRADLKSSWRINSVYPQHIKVLTYPFTISVASRLSARAHINISLSDGFVSVSRNLTKVIWVHITQGISQTLRILRWLHSAKSASAHSEGWGSWQIVPVVKISLVQSGEISWGN